MRCVPLKKLKQYTIHDKTICMLTCILLLLILIPMLYIAVYNVPCVDDYNYGNLTHRAWEQSGSLLEVIKTAGEQVGITYQNWQGTFSAIFMMAVQPAVFGESFYFLVPYIMLTALLGGVFFFCYALFRKTFQASRFQFITISAVLAITCTQFLPSASQGFYWYNGSVFYTFFFGISLIAYALTILYLQSGDKIWRAGYLIGISLLSFIIGGSNYVTSLVTLLLFGMLLVTLLIKKNPKWKTLLIPFALLAAAFVINAAAPGNAVRQGFFQDTPSIPGAIFYAFRYAVHSAQDWLTLPFICLLIFLIPLLWKIASKSDFSFRLPLLVFFFSAGLYAAMFCPPVYAMNSTGDKRLTNIIFYAFTMLVVFNLFYVIGWMQNRLKHHMKQNGVQTYQLPVCKDSCPVVFILLIFAAFLFNCVMMSDSMTFTSVSAVQSLRSGEAEQYYDAAQERLVLLKDDTLKDVVLQPYPVKPYVLYFDDITSDPDNSRNKHMRKYYDKRSVRLP
ncbi:DUF6056 family protein [Candidatus Soleaferrea massiliensis]|uniref:DUF6056 family protein n=1 Tax=Candidatus Soleaferrea massiliensis TaxID=1470354 RepID=UPI00058F64C7|nr:DUF6056 family protein [Candidatus Soleaferrea massiliensis]